MKQVEKLNCDDDCLKTDASLTVGLTEINENLKNQFEVLSENLAKCEGNEEMTSELSLVKDDVNELVERYRKLGRRFGKLKKCCEKLNEIVDKAHARNRELEGALGKLRQENLDLVEKARGHNRISFGPTATD
jgi:chromosome segregation ATPase